MAHLAIPCVYRKHIEKLQMTEYTAMTEDAKGGTQAVTIMAYSTACATAKLLKMGYFRVIWVQ